MGSSAEKVPAVPRVLVTLELGMATLAPELVSHEDGVKLTVPVEGLPSGVRNVPNTVTVVTLAGSGIMPPRLRCGR